MHRFFALAGGVHLPVHPLLGVSKANVNDATLRIASAPRQSSATQLCSRTFESCASANATSVILQRFSELLVVGCG